jgi:hypothetical protein
VVALVSGANRLDEGRLGAAAGTPVSKADAEIARLATGYSIGGVPPFGHATEVPVFMDRDLLSHRVVWAAAGRPDSVFEINPERLRELSQATVADLKSRRRGEMSSILIFCRDCGKQVPSSEARDGLCLDCRVRRSVADLRDEHARLWRKRERYRSQNANVEQIGRQIARVEDRMGQRIKELVSNDRQANDYMRKELEAARGQRYTIKGV